MWADTSATIRQQLQSPFWGYDVTVDAEVGIVGYGPVGAVMAGLLARRGIKALVIEKDEEVFPLPRAAHIDHTGLRTIQELGCVDQILPMTVRNKRLDLLDAKKQILARIPADQPSISNLPSSVYFYQPDFDSLLRKSVSAMPCVDTRLGVEMTNFELQGDRVILETRNLSGGSETVSVRWLVGCDGSWSPVRERMGIRLENLNFDERWLVLDLLLEEPQPELPRDHVVEVCDPDRPYLTTPISDNRQRFEFMLLPDDNPESIITDTETRRLLSSWLSGDGYKVERSAVYTFHGLIAQQWRRGRVLIAGDAAHQTPPFLGQGMCAGIRDAANLAWKLAGVIQDRFPDAILNTYEIERKPHALKVIEAAIRIGKVICELDVEKAAIRNKYLLDDDPLTHKELSFTLPRLSRGPLVMENGGGLFIQPNVEGARLDDVVGNGFFVFGRSTDVLGEDARWWEEEMGAVVQSGERFECPALLHWLDQRDHDVVVVRPDRYVLGAGSSLAQITRNMRSYLADAYSVPVS